MGRPTVTRIEAGHPAFLRTARLLASALHVQVADLTGGTYYPAESADQLELPFEPDDGRELDAALDRVRERFGVGAITRAVLLGKDQGTVMPLLPD